MKFETAIVNTKDVERHFTCPACETPLEIIGIDKLTPHEMYTLIKETPASEMKCASCGSVMIDEPTRQEMLETMELIYDEILGQDIKSA